MKREVCNTLDARGSYFTLGITPDTQGRFAII